MSTLVTLKSTGVGYTLLIGGKVVKTGLPSISSAKIWMTKNYGRKFEPSYSVFPGGGGTVIGAKNPLGPHPSYKKRSATKALKTKAVVKRKKAKKALGVFGLKAKGKKNPKLGPRKETILGFKVLVYRDGFRQPFAAEVQGTAPSIERGREIKRIVANALELDPKNVKVMAKKSNPKTKSKSSKKRAIPAAFKAAAQRAKAMTPAQRSAWAKKMQAARKAKSRNPKDTPSGENAHVLQNIVWAGSNGYGPVSKLTVTQQELKRDGYITAKDYGDGYVLTATAKGKRAV